MNGEIAFKGDAIAAAPGEGLGVDPTKIEAIAIPEEDDKRKVEGSGQLGGDAIFVGITAAEGRHVAVAYTPAE